MKLHMKLQKCQVDSCGAMVLVLDVEGTTLPVNPMQTQLAVQQDDGAFQLVTGFQPHAYTCVDIAARLEAKEQAKRQER